MNPLSLNLRRLCPINEWAEDVEGPVWWPGTNCNKPYYVIDRTTNDKYLNQDKSNIRSKCLAAVFASLFLHPISIIGNVIWRIIKLISFFEFWKKPNMKDIQKIYPENFKEEYERRLTLKSRSTEYMQDALRIILAPFVVPLLTLSALYGIVRPYDGRKVHATIEAAFYGSGFYAPCFQPLRHQNLPIKHLLGGDINDPSAW